MGARIAGWGGGGPVLAPVPPDPCQGGPSSAPKITLVSVKK